MTDQSPIGFDPKRKQGKIDQSDHHERVENCQQANKPTNQQP
jgi:hypothetical protein